MAIDRRQTPRQGSEDRRRPGNQFGRGTGIFAETVNRTFAILRREQEENGSLLSNDNEGVS